ncbi:MAG: VOC family protein [Candidatus Kapaibacterium sp.]
MKLNHLNLCVPDIAETRAFFETFFRFRCTDAKGSLVVLEGEDGFILVLSNLGKVDAVDYPAEFHFGFILNDPAEVYATYERLTAGGIGIPHGVREMRGSLAFYCRIPGNILLEVSASLASS